MVSTKIFFSDLGVNKLLCEYMLRRGRGSPCYMAMSSRQILIYIIRNKSMFYMINNYNLSLTHLFKADRTLHIRLKLELRAKRCQVV